MSVIQLEIEDTLIQQIGAKTVQSFIERQLSFLRLQYLGEQVATEIIKSGIDHQKEVEEVCEEAWKEYKSKYLQDAL
ncbi:MAG: hypothetical protein HQM12_04135 [SAR324 cluster bacterium]|nr:hypothetical protein [SAR324 cluster bacterium]